MKIFEFEQDGCSARLQNSITTDSIFWSETGNSFVLVADLAGPWVAPCGEVVGLFSINGIGEIRWEVCNVTRKTAEEQAAITHFKLRSVKD
jgi:hypothetical protein